MDNKTLTIGCDLNGRTITSSIPDITVISELKYIAKVNDDTYIAENLMAVEGQTGDCSCVYYHYLDENDDPVTEIFYCKNGGTVVTNLESFTLPDDFGVITEIDDTAVCYDYLTRGCHEKVYVMCEDFCKEESMTKGQIKDEVADYINEKLDYSTDEKVIGTWIDGKPLYRKIIHLDSYTSKPTNQTNIYVDVDNIDTNVSRDWSALWVAPNQFINGNSTYDGTRYWVLRNILVGNIMYIQSNDETILSNVNIILEYTKTTD